MFYSEFALSLNEVTELNLKPEIKVTTATTAVLSVLSVLSRRCSHIHQLFQLFSICLFPPGRVLGLTFLASIFFLKLVYCDDWILTFFLYFLLRFVIIGCLHKQTLLKLIKYPRMNLFCEFYGLVKTFLLDGNNQKLHRSIFGWHVDVNLNICTLFKWNLPPTTAPTTNQSRFWMKDLHFWGLFFFDETL